MTLEQVAGGLMFPAGPLWRDGRLLFSDFHALRVQAVEPEGSVATVCEVAGQPSGLGFDADGRLLVVSMLDRRLLRLDPEGLTEVADLAALTGGPCNDMVVDGSGRAWVGEFGYDYGAPVRTAGIVRVDPDGAATRVADGVHLPNGLVMTQHGTLVVAETLGQRLTAFDVGDDGALGAPRPWATFAPEPAAGFPEAIASGAITPDGICLDAEGAIWVADMAGGAAVRVLQGGEVTDVVPAGEGLTAFAVALGGEDGRTLFVCAGPRIGEGDPRTEHRGLILAARVGVPVAR
jgi:sugar lactone lactonase YvrE